MMQEEKVESSSGYNSIECGHSPFPESSDTLISHNGPEGTQRGPVLIQSCIDGNGGSDVFRNGMGAQDGIGGQELLLPCLDYIQWLHQQTPECSTE